MMIVCSLPHTTGKSRLWRRPGAFLIETLTASVEPCKSSGLRPPAEKSEEQKKAKDPGGSFSLMVLQALVADGLQLVTVVVSVILDSRGVDSVGRISP